MAEGRPWRRAPRGGGEHGPRRPVTGARFAFLPRRRCWMLAPVASVTSYQLSAMSSEIRMLVSVVTASVAWSRSWSRCPSNEAISGASRSAMSSALGGVPARSVAKRRSSWNVWP